MFFLIGALGQNFGYIQFRKSVRSQFAHQPREREYGLCAGKEYDMNMNVRVMGNNMGDTLQTVGTT
jgi:hypothetical protein